MKIVLLGKNGQLGWEMQRALAPLGELIVLDRHSRDYVGDLSNLTALTQTIRKLKPGIVVNAAAYTAVDKAQSEEDLAFRINAEAPAILSQILAEQGGLLVHFSTDYVFDGKGIHFWEETDPTGPLNVYGKSKLQGERAIITSACKHLIFRTSWVYGTQGNNFIKTILRLTNERDKLSIINDQIGAPTGADLLADVSAHCIRAVMTNNQNTGLYHIAPQGETSWYAYAQFIVEQAQNLHLLAKNPEIVAISSSDYPTAALRPLNSRLATHKLQDTFKLALPPWQNGVRRMLAELRN